MSPFRSSYFFWLNKLYSKPSRTNGHIVHTKTFSKSETNIMGLFIWYLKLQTQAEDWISEKSIGTGLGSRSTIG